MGVRGWGGRWCVRMGTGVLEDGDRGVRGWGGRYCVRMGTGVLEDGEGGGVLGWGQGC